MTKHNMDKNKLLKTTLRSQHQKQGNTTIADSHKSKGFLHQNSYENEIEEDQEDNNEEIESI